MVLAMFMFDSGHAAVNLLEFNSPEQEARYKQLIAELRCTVCQNQNLADSGAGLAKDLRKNTYDMIIGGKSNDEIVNYMVERYGEFVLYRPPLKPTTALLWFGPLLFLLIAAITYWTYTRRRRNNPVARLTPEQREQASRLLDRN